MKFSNKHVLLGSAMAFFLLISASIFGQNNKWAVQAGAGFSNTHNYGSTDYYPTKSGFSWAANAVWEREFKHPKFGLMLEPGVSFDAYLATNLAPEQQNITVRLSQVQVPMLAYFKPTRTDLIKVVLGVVPTYRFDESVGVLDRYYDNNYHEIFSVSYALGVQIKATNRMAFGARAMQTLTPITSITFTDAIGNETIHDVYFRSLRAYARYYFK